MPSFLIVLILLAGAAAEEFSGEAYLLGASVANNGTSAALPSRHHTATRYLDFPGDIGDDRTFRVEMATMPLFAGLSEIWDGAASYALDSHTQVNVFGQLATTPDIQVLPLLRGTAEDRLNDPGFRPDGCGDCYRMRDVVYLANLNFMRKYDGEFPRMDISSRPIPIRFSVGVTAKYFYEELEGGDYIAQNLNVDAGVCMQLFWGFDPISKVSDRNVKIQFSGFELLPTSQQSEFGGTQVFERMDRRWRMSASWEEGLPSLASTLSAGLTQKSEQGAVPGFGVEWDLREMLYLRCGMDAEFLSAGTSLAWKWFSVHYAFRHHELGTSLYQLSAQVQWP